LSDGVAAKDIETVQRVITRLRQNLESIEAEA
jgi:hypothetical protein